MKTVAYISPGPTYNAHSEIFQSKYKYLSKYIKGYLFTTSPKYDKFIIGNIEYISMKSKNKTIDIIKYALFCLWYSLKLLIQGNRIHLVVTYDPLKTGLIGLMVARIHNAKFAPEVNGVYTSPYIWLDDIDKWETKVKKILYPIVMKYVLKNADGIKLLFKEQIDLFKNILDFKIIHDFHNYVPIERFRYIRSNKEVLFVGYPYKSKGVDILIEAFKRIASKHPDWKLKILGWYPHPEELLRAIDGHPQIYHHPPVNYDQMIEHMGSCAILVLPSRSEGMGRVLVEAMAAEKPRIGSNIDGIPTVIDDGIDGLLVKPGDVNDLAEKLDVLMGDQGLRKRLGLAAKARVSREFTKEIYFENLLRFYKEVLG